MNTYTLEEVRQKAAGAGGRREEKVLTGKGFFITLLSGHDISGMGILVEWAFWWNGYLGGMGILVEWASWWNGHFGGMGILVELNLAVVYIFTPWQGQAGCLLPLTTYIHPAPQQCHNSYIYPAFLNYGRANIKSGYT
ncbi:MAG: hypothetical protein F6K39_36970, partial [Okeania sp. SIO3B3]|nr:hypothetical protein [Okeania sp. SIO3B3]